MTHVWLIEAYTETQEVDAGIATTKEKAVQMVAGAILHLFPTTSKVDVVEKHPHYLIASKGSVKVTATRYPLNTLTI